MIGLRPRLDDYEDEWSRPKIIYFESDIPVIMLHPARCMALEYLGSRNEIFDSL